MGNCVSSAAAIPYVLDVAETGAGAEVQSLELKCQSLALELERSEDEYFEQVAVSTELWRNSPFWDVSAQAGIKYLKKNPIGPFQDHVFNQKES